MRVTRGVTDRQTTITTAAPHARERASERASERRRSAQRAHACVEGERKTVTTRAMRGDDVRVRARDARRA